MRLSIDTGRLSLEEMAALASALTTLSDVLSGQLSQPRFYDSATHRNNAAGDVLEDIAEGIGFAIEDLRNAARSRRPQSDDERDQKFALLARELTDGLRSPEDAIDGMRAIVDRLDRAIAEDVLL